MFRDMKEVYKDIPKYRMRKFMTCEELADKIGVPEYYLRMVEKGCAELTMIEFMALCQLLELDPDEVLSK